MKPTPAVPVIALVLLAACGKDEPPPTPAPEPQGRVETRAIRNTDAIGYSGSAIADKVDGALNANDQHVKDVERQSNAGESGDAPPQE